MARIGRDSLSVADRRLLMSRIRTKNTAPELTTRRLLHRAGLRFTVDGPRNRSLPGRPDIVLPRHRVVVFVHGCFWHRHSGCPKCTTPTARKEFWLEKFQANVARDKRQASELRRMGWRVVNVWECETSNQRKLVTRLLRVFEIAGTVPRRLANARVRR
ncbi:MAG TPA: DNA mismatch endonuclease Vsr [Opitutaceae bacterium]|nr:DNA mismatch endonuclease Vsr [Opitutaceae bacterium]